MLGALLLIILYLGYLGSCIWVVVDARSIGVQKGQIKGFLDMGPWGWFFVCLFVWLIGFTAYLVQRNEYKRINEKTNKTASITAVYCTNCGQPIIAPQTKFCPKCGNNLQRAIDT